MLRLRILVVFGWSLFLLAAVPVATYQWVYADRTYLGVRAAGLDLGGYAREEAQAALRARFEAYARRPIILRDGEQTWRAKPDELGLRLDAAQAGAAAHALGRSGSIFQRLGEQATALLGGHEVRAGLTVQDEPLTAYLGTVAAQVDRPTRDAKLILTPEPKVQLLPSQAGRRLNREEATRLLQERLLGLADGPVALPVEETPPRIAEGDLAETQALAESMLAAPLALRFADRQWTLTPRDIAQMLLFQDGARGRAMLEEARLTGVLERIAREVDRRPRSARFAWQGGRLEVIEEATEGYRLDVVAAARLIQDAVRGTARTLELPVAVLRPPVTGQEAAKLNIQALIEEASTLYAPGVPERLHNVQLAASRLNGVVVPPGEVFSFNEALGPTTLAAGYRVGWGITRSGEEVKTVPAVAGGICQVATTLFQAVFWAGHQIEERRPHLYWIARYGQPPKGMKGLDATVDEEGGLDFQFRNNTPHYLLIQARTEAQKLIFSLYGTKPAWQVQVEGPQIEAVVKADQEVVRQEERTMPAGQELVVEAAEDGFRATIVRTVVGDGQPRVLRLVSDYQPSRNVVLVGTKR